MMPAAQIDGFAKARRINVVGCFGAGKSTLNQRLAKLKNIPYVEMDQLFWDPNWQEPSGEEFAQGEKCGCGRDPDSGWQLLLYAKHEVPAHPSRSVFIYTVPCRLVIG